MRNLACLLLLAFVTAPLAGQDRSRDTVLVDHTFRMAAPDTVVVALTRRSVYRLVVSVGAIEPVLQAVTQGVPAPFVAPGDTLGQFSLYVSRDGEYLLLPPTGSATDVRIRLLGDAAASRARQEVQDAPRWTVGGEVALARHSGNNAAAGGTAGWQGDLCLSMRSGRRLSACLGYTSQERLIGQHLDWFFLEPRVALWQTAQYEAGVSLRLAQANQSGGASFDVSMVAPGIYLASHLTRTPSGRGVDLRLSGLVGSLGNLPQGTSSDVIYRLALGINWHP